MPNPSLGERRQRGAALSVLVVLVLAGCAARNNVADLTDRAWRELRTDRIVLVTDLDAAQARERVREFEELGAALTDLYTVFVPRRAVPTRPIRVIHLARCDELRRRYGERVGGFVTWSADFGGERLVITCEWAGSFRAETVIHELTHDLNHRYLADLPPWLEEGLATYFQTLRLEDGNAVLGLRPSVDRHFWKSVAILPRMPELMAMSQQKLLDLGERRGYFAAWKLTHLLANGGDDHLPRFRRMLSALGSGQGSDEAFAAGFGDVRERVAADYGTYHLRTELRNLAAAVSKGGRQRDPEGAGPAAGRGSCSLHRDPAFRR